MLKRRKKSLSEYSTGELVMFRFRKNKLAMFACSCWLSCSWRCWPPRF